MNREQLLKGLSPEQIEKARACHDNKELLELAKQEGIELNEEQLAAVSGGGCHQEVTIVCPMCGSTDVEKSYNPFDNNSKGAYKCKCNQCGCRFKKNDE